jgi:hypothetical protein
MKTLHLIVTLAFLGSVPAASQTKAPRVKSRRLASVDRSWSEPRISASAKREKRDVVLKLGLTSGYAQTSTNVGNAQAAREKSGQNKGVSLGLNARLGFLSYGYADLDGYYAGNLSSNSVQAVDPVTGSSNVSVQSVRSYGALTEVGARVPMGKGSVRWTPTLGLGFGYLAVRDETSQDASLQVSKSTALGPYVSAGLGVSLGKRFSLSGDGALSVLASGTVERPGISEDEASSAQFLRVRAGAYYRITAPITLGVQFIQRRIQATPAGETIPFKETTNQFLGSLQVTF